MNKLIAVIAENEQSIDKAMQLSQELSLPFFEKSCLATEFELFLLVAGDVTRIQQKIGDKNFVLADFTSPKLLFRAKHASFKKELIAKAMGVRPKDDPFIVDATAGLGRDSFILASLGFKVIMLEKSAIIAHLLKNGIDRANKNQELASIMARMTLIHTDAEKWLKNAELQDKRPDVIYLDPMFPPRKKTASVKKEMVIFHNLLGSDENSLGLLEIALTCAKNRVVVKRPKLEQPLAIQLLTYSLTGKSSRFDIYMVKK